MSVKDMIINFDEPKEKAALMNMVRVLRGKQRVSVIQYRARRTDRQNRYYWPCFVQPFGEYLREQGEQITDEEAHEFFKVKFLRRAIPSPSTGEVIGYAIRSTTDLNTVEFNEYLDRCAMWLADMFHIVVPEPSVYHERD